MRLIDAEALKEKLDELEPYIYCDENSTTWILSDEVYNAIDKAPVVEPEKVLIASVTFDEDKLKDIVQAKVIDKIKNGELVLKDERQQGEWKVKTLSTFPQYQPDEYECPFCKTIVNYKTNFCPNCGADMRGDKNG